MLSSSPNWFCSKVSDVSVGEPTLFGFGSRNVLRLLQVSSASDQPDARLPFFVGSLHGHKRASRITAFAFSRAVASAHICVTGASDRSVRIWDSRSCACLVVHSKHAAEVSCLAVSVSVNSLVFSADKGGNLMKWDYFKQSNQPSSLAHLMQGVAGGITCLSCCPDEAADKVAVGCQSGAVFVIDVKRESLTRLQGTEQVQPAQS